MHGVDGAILCGVGIWLIMRFHVLRSFWKDHFEPPGFSPDVDLKACFMDTPGWQQLITQKDRAVPGSHALRHCELIFLPTVRSNQRSAGPTKAAFSGIPPVSQSFAGRKYLGDRVNSVDPRSNEWNVGDPSWASDETRRDKMRNVSKHDGSHCNPPGMCGIYIYMCVCVFLFSVFFLRWIDLLQTMHQSSINQFTFQTPVAIRAETPRWFPT